MSEYIFDFSTEARFSELHRPHHQIPVEDASGASLGYASLAEDGMTTFDLPSEIVKQLHDGNFKPRLRANEVPATDHNGEVRRLQSWFIVIS